MEPLLLYQDNMSAILLETNSKASGSKQTKHIKVKYFYVKDKIEQGEITVEQCPTEQMWTYINTKPKQGALFREFRGQVMGISCYYVDSILEHSIYLWLPNSPVGYEPTTEPAVSPERAMLPAPKDSVALQECVEGDMSSGAADCMDTEVATERQVATKHEMACAERMRADLRICQTSYPIND